MLLLTRKPGETIVINDNIKITPLGINGNQVKIGIDAPQNVAIHREEIYDRILTENNSNSILDLPINIRKRNKDGNR